MALRPYAGITGFTHPSEVEAVSNFLDTLDWPESHLVMLGTLVSGWTLNGQPPSDPRQYPSLQEMRHLVSPHPAVLNLLHCNNGRQPVVWMDQLMRLYDALPMFQGVQLNAAWPNPIDLRRFRRASGWSMVVQVGQDAVREAAGAPIEFLRTPLDAAASTVEWLRSYLGDVCDGVLFDMSGGLGRSLDPELARAMIGCCQAFGRAVAWNLSVGIAGGLDGMNVQAQVGPLMALDKTISWDAQGRLRAPDGSRLDPEKWKPYLEASRELIATMAD